MDYINFRVMKINELRNYTIKHNLDVIGTGKRDGLAIRRDFILACEKYYNEQRKIKNDEIKAKVDSVFGTTDGLIVVYKNEKMDVLLTLSRLLIYAMEKSYESDVSEDNIKYIFAEYNRLKNKCIKNNIDTRMLQKTGEKFRETHGYRLEDDIL